MRHVSWSPRAQADLRDVDDHYAELSPNFVDRFGDAAIAAADFLAERPYAGTPQPDSVRKWPVRKSPYILLYQVFDDEIHILRVRHNRSNWREL